MQKKLKEDGYVHVEVVGKEIKNWLWYSQEKNKKLKESDPRLDYLASLPKLTNLLDSKCFA